MALTIAPGNIRTSPLFLGLTEKDTDNLLSGGHLHPLAQGSILFHQGEVITHFHLITSGTMQLHRVTGNGHEKTLDIVKANQPFCESEVMDDTRYHRASATAVDDVMVMKFPVAWLREAAKYSSDFALNLLCLISQQAHMAEVEAEHQASMSAAQLVACFLQRLCFLHDFDPKNFDLPYSKTLIASRLGMELATFSRALAKLRHQHLTVTGIHVAISDSERIGDYVCSVCPIVESCPAHHALRKAAFPIIMTG